MLLSIINTFLADDFKNISKNLLYKHLNKFKPIKNTEVIICIDNCNETNEKYLKCILEYEKYGFIIKKIYKHIFAGGCRNEGLRVAIGKYVMFIDSYDDSLDSSKEFNLKNILDNLIEYLHSIELEAKNKLKNISIIELSNIYNEFYRAMPWNVFFNNEFLKANHIKFIEWQGYEDFLFLFICYKLSKYISIFINDSNKLLIYNIKNHTRKYIKVNSKNIHRIVYNHAYANTFEDYQIRSYEKYNEACKYLLKYFNEVPKEFIIEMIVTNIDNEFSKELLKNNINIKSNKNDIFKYIFKNIEENFLNEKYLQISF